MRFYFEPLTNAHQFYAYSALLHVLIFCIATCSKVLQSHSNIWVVIFSFFWSGETVEIEVFKQAHYFMCGKAVNWLALISLSNYMFRIISNLIPPLTHHQFIFNSSIHHHNTRSKSKIHTRYCRTAMRQNTFAFQGPRLWSELPSYLTTATSLPIFKKIAKSFFVNKICSIWIQFLIVFIDDSCVSEMCVCFFLFSFFSLSHHLI